VSYVEHAAEGRAAGTGCAPANAGATGHGTRLSGWGDDRNGALRAPGEFYSRGGAARPAVKGEAA
jgi:hypothetical protein